MENNINRPSKGLNTDSSPQEQAKDTYRFALNAIMESEEGDLGFISNEEANENYTNIPTDFIIIGKVYIGNEQTLLFLVNEDETEDQIGILDKDGSYLPQVEGTDVLGFRIYNQIDATFRLRKGCERTVYFVEKGNKPRLYNIDKPQDFKTNGSWSASKFNLFKIYNSIPYFTDLEIKLGEGNLLSGSYNFAIQYLDKDLNPTEWITTSDTVIIYRDNPTAMPFQDVKGSTSVKDDVRDIPATNKSIKLSVDNLDSEYPYYRVAAIAANTGNGIVTTVEVSGNISTQTKIYNYTGNQISQVLTEEELNTFNNVIERAENINQLENRLVLGKTEGKQVDYCKLQKYASKIFANVVTEEITLNVLQEENNQKRGTINNEKVGYMPGELYSFGIVYIFEDNTVSPVYHIPGKSDDTTPSDMSSNNTLDNTSYLDVNACSTGSYWGYDSQGNTLKNKPVRHHKFPTRAELGLPLFEKDSGELNEINDLSINLDFYVDNIQSYYEANTSATVDNNVYGLRFFIIAEIENGALDPVISDLESVSLLPIDATDAEESYNLSDYLSRLASTTTGDITNIMLYEALPNSLEDVPDSTLSTDIIAEDYTRFSAPISFDANIEGIDPESGSFALKSSTKTSSESSGEYTFYVTDSVINIDNSLYTSTILGIDFSNIEKPDLDSSSGENIIGYYIVRNERTDDTRTVLDSGIVAPITYDNKFASFALLNPSSGNISENVFALINPEFLFNKKEYFPQNIVLAGQYNVEKFEPSAVEVQDAADGSSYDEATASRKAKKDPDADGYTLRVVGRYAKTSFTTLNTDETFISGSNLKSVYGLNALQTNNAKVNGETRILINAAPDNRANIIETNFDEDGIESGRTFDRNVIPYVYLTAENGDKYSNYKELPYYKETINPALFTNGDVSSVSVFHGDSYISPLTYTNTFFYRNQLRKRDKKNGLGNIIAGSLAIIGGVIATIYGGPAGIAIISAGVSRLSTGLEANAAKKAYETYYEAGLTDSISDSYMKHNNTFQDNPNDDEIDWFMDGYSNIFLESNINMNWRMGSTFFTDYMESPNSFDASSWKTYAKEKLTVPDSSRDDGLLYQTFPFPELYDMNLDYLRRDRQKYYFSLPDSFDCCSNCVESFPHRVVYSTQSFQEEQIDNYRVFLPNNYRDIEGETGEITNLFRIQNNLYIQTQEGLWHLPQTHQERITSDIVSFIGTGEFFAVPPRKITDDDNGMSAGTEHKWATIKFPSGVMFISEKQGTVWMFDGNQLKPISSNGMNSWFKNNLRSKFEENYYNSNGVEYPYKNNPSNPIGTGFISTYDSRNERLLLTKKDSILGNTVAEGEDYTLCYKNNETIVFENVSQTILDKEATTNDDGNPWQYVGMDEKACELEFESIAITTMLTEKVIGFPNTADLFVFYDTTSLSSTTIEFLRNLVTGWEDVYRNQENWVGTLYQIEGLNIEAIDPTDTEKTVVSKFINNNTQSNIVTIENYSNENKIERWLTYPNTAKTINEKYVSVNGFTTTDDMVVVGFVDECQSGQNTNSTTNNAAEEDAYILANNGVWEEGGYHYYYPHENLPPETVTSFAADKTAFINLRDSLNSFAGLIYTPLNYYPNNDADDYSPRIEFMKHVVASIEGDNLTDTIINNISNVNGETYSGLWEDVVNDVGFKDTLKTATADNNLFTTSLRTLGWDYNMENYQSTDMKSLLVPGESGGTIMTAEDFTEDMNEFISNTTEIVTEEVEVETVEYDYIGGVASEETPLENSWTMSYSLKFGTWTSFHSYIPSIYIHTPDRFFSWKVGDNNIWKHNIPNSFQTYYGALAPFIVEYVSVSNPMTTRIWDSIKLYTEAKKFNTNLQSNVDERFVTFNKLIAYNTRQTTGEVNLEVKDTNADQSNYLMQQVASPTPGTIIIDRNERDWNLNDLRDVRVDYSQPIFNETLTARQQDYYIDKVINVNTIDVNKDWTQVESFRDKYLVLRLIFDNFDDVKLILNYSAELEKPSYR
jgi:hypothetical protein